MNAAGKMPIADAGGLAWNDVVAGVLLEAPRWSELQAKMKQVTVVRIATDLLGIVNKLIERFDQSIA